MNRYKRMAASLVICTDLLLLSACNANKTAAPKSRQGTSAASSSKVTPTQTSPKGGVKASGRGRTQSAPLIENERGGDPNKSALNVQFHP